MNNLYENLITDNIQESDFLLSNINNKILIITFRNLISTFLHNNLDLMWLNDCYLAKSSPSTDLMDVRLFFLNFSKFKKFKKLKYK